MDSVRKNRFVFSLVVSAGSIVILLAPYSSALADHILPAIEHGDIAVRLRPVAVGMAAPLYGINPPGDTSRLFVLEQKGQILVLENGALRPTPALDIQSLVSPPLIITNANDERGLLGLAFHPGFTDPVSPGFRTQLRLGSQRGELSFQPVGRHHRRS